ncbi:hypothetical protein [Actinoplanes siamensis]|uniref:Uncharacterized protein n=1 Tax=Actinoplanes siamensis TaxID=1223317 RepID=A0A919ND69_9ACTN|nr:hypothetical protein [Actinoplanes siamensis]GIF08657.1 hypothetical protein Asi03nite_61950 [Actinoplanes siamensis]
MTLQVSQTVSAGGITPAPLTPAASDTVAEGSFGPTGVVVRITTTSTPTNFSVSDPTTTGLGNTGTVTPVTIPSGATRKFYIPRAAINPNTQVATLNFSATTGVTYELDRW